MIRCFFILIVKLFYNPKARAQCILLYPSRNFSPTFEVSATFTGDWEKELRKMKKKKNEPKERKLRGERRREGGIKREGESRQPQYN